MMQQNVVSQRDSDIDRYIPVKIKGNSSRRNIYLKRCMKSICKFCKHTGRVRYYEVYEESKNKVRN